MERYSVHLKLLGMAVLWGASWPMGRMLGQSAAADGRGGSVCAGFGFAVGLVVCAQQVCDFGGFVGTAMAGIDGGRFRRGMRLCGVFMLGLQEMPAGKAAVVVAVNPVLTLLLAAWLFGERLNAKILAGMLLAVCGAITAVTQGQPLAVLSGGIKAGSG